MADIQIACPKCHWEPDGGAHWACTCGCVWNTFDTAATCPNCNKQWTHTACVPNKGGCTSMPPHVDWYRNLDDWVLEEVASAQEQLA